MGAAVELVVGGPGHVYTFVLAVLSLLAVVLVPYHRYVSFLKWTTFSLFAYVGVVFTVHIDWRAVAIGAVLPRFALNSETITLIVAIFGTTISPYLFFWQSSQEVEDEEADPEAGPLIDHPEQASRELGRIGWETWLGMAFSNLVAFFIILTTAVTLNAHGQTDIQTSAQAAAALRPIAGDFAFALFSLGIIGTGLLAVPVLAGSAAYAVGETGGWTTGLERSAARGLAVLCRDRHRHPAGRLRRSLAARPDQGADLERGAERRDHRADDGGNHDRGVASRAYGRVRRHPQPAHPRLADNGHDDHRLDRHVPVDVTALAHSLTAGSTTRVKMPNGIVLCSGPP